jgi:peptidoglycan hydrolase-like protein with peptidoglycan-binding domain
VKWLQYELSKQGYTITIDGIFGPATEAAVRMFQNERALISDGIVGPVTIGALIN